MPVQAVTGFFRIRRGPPAALDPVGRVLASSPEASQWKPADCLSYDFTVAEAGGEVAGFLVTRTLAEGEHEILNLGVAPAWRRQGVGRALLNDAFGRLKGDVYL